MPHGTQQEELTYHQLPGQTIQVAIMKIFQQMLPRKIFQQLLPTIRMVTMEVPQEEVDLQDMEETNPMVEVDLLDHQAEANPVLEVDLQDPQTEVPPAEEVDLQDLQDLQEEVEAVDHQVVVAHLMEDLQEETPLVPLDLQIHLVLTSI